MIAHIRSRLTILYTTVFGVFLLAFVSVVCGSVFWTTYNERIEEITLLAKRIAREQRQVLLQHNRTPHSPPVEMSIEEDYDISGQVFYYVLDIDRRLVKADLPVSALRQAILAKIMAWDSSEKTRLITVPLATGHDATIIITEQCVVSGGNQIGIVYVGRDVTAFTRTVLHGIFIITMTAILFFALAMVIGYFLSGKVIIPIGQSIDRQKQFVADASHELRNPLSVLLTSIEAVEMDKDNVLSPFSKQIMNDAKEEFARLKRLVNDLLTLARIDAGDTHVHKETIGLNAMTEQVIRSLKAVAERKEVNIALEADELLELYADSERLYQILYILIENAIKYSPAKTNVSVQIKRAANGVKIVVTDRGPGIRPEFHDRIFERFFRVDEARSRDIEGSGLGLPIARSIVDAHHGTITVYSKPGEGTQFVVFLPNN